MFAFDYISFIIFRIITAIEASCPAANPKDPVEFHATAFIQQFGWKS